MSTRNRKKHSTKTKTFSGLLERCSKEQKDNKDFVIEKVKYDGLTIQHASSRLRNDIDIINIALEQNPKSFSVISKQLRSNKNIIEKVLQVLILKEYDYYNDFDEYSVFNCVPKDIRNTKSIALVFVKYFGRLLGEFDDTIKNNYKIVLKALDNSPKALEFAPNSVQNNRKLLMKLLLKDPNCFQFLLPHLKNDKELVLYALQKNVSIFQYLPEELQLDNDVISIGIRQAQLFAKTIQNECPNFKLSIDVCKKFIQSNPLSLQYLPDSIRDNKEVVELALKNNPRTFKYVSNRLKCDPDIAIIVVNENEFLMYELPKTLKDNPDFIRRVINEIGIGCVGIPEDVKRKALSKYKSARK